jgi:hypothetical protein
MGRSNALVVADTETKSRRDYATHEKLKRQYCPVLPRYFKCALELLKELRTRDQLLAIAEMGNESHPEKARHILVVCSKWALAPGRYPGASGVTLISLLATLSLSGGSLKPMFLMISEGHYNDYDLGIQKGAFVVCKTSRGHMRSE